MARQGTMLKFSRWTSQDGTYRILKTNLTKAHYRGLKYMIETLKLIPQKPDTLHDILVKKILYLYSQNYETFLTQVASLYVDMN